MLLQLSLLAEPTGGWILSLGRPGAQPVRGHLAGAGVAELRLAVGRALQAVEAPALALAGEDAEWTAAEDDAGRRLGRALVGDPALARLLSQAEGAAQARGEPLVLLVGAEEPAARALPWECLALEALGPPLERNGQGLVVRLGPASGSPPRAGPVQVLVWRSEARDPGVERLARSVERSLRAAGFPVSPAGAEPGEGPALVVLIGHGEAVDAGLRLRGEGGARAPGSVAHALAPWVSRARLVIAFVCEGGVRPAGAPDGLVDRLLLAGAESVLACDTRLSEEAAEAFLDGFLPALSQGQDLARATIAGRRAVAGLALPWPDSRWWRMQLTVADGEVLSRGLRGPALLGGRRPGVGLASTLERAWGEARRRGHGWLGVEHLALALDPRQLSDPRLRQLLRVYQGPIERRLQQFEPAPAPEGRLSPRLRSALDRLSEGFEVDDLVGVLLADLPAPLGLRLGLVGGSVPMDPFGGGLVDDAATRDTGSPDLLGDGPACRLEVVGGPEDGARLELRPGVVLGRWSEGGELGLALYRDAGGVDGFLSRRHLAAQAEGRVELLRPARALIGEGAPRRVSGVVELRPGHLLALTEATLLIAC